MTYVANKAFLKHIDVEAQEHKKLRQRIPMVTSTKDLCRLTITEQFVK
jgi:hypothetical protein